ncbi:MAG TPA: LL-diaminopimelate aminotransferase [Candidatus Baltobacteraceae bacterium]|nr:LL-diaminopimelate aminotransferase [Candidatus Baltobacteraceae bacterium]
MSSYTQSERLRALPPYLFAELDRMKQEQVKKGVDIISLGIGDPDLPTPPHIIEALAKAAVDPANHQYPSYEGMLAFRRAAADWYQARFGVALDPAKEVLTLIGSKEGIGHLPLAFVSPGDVVLVPDPGYPVYAAGTLFAGGESYALPLTPARNFLPDLDAIPAAVVKRAKILWLNYPNNPTGAVAPREFLAQAVDFARRHRLILAHDAPYSEIAYDGYRPESILAVPGARDVAVEFHSVSKTYNMTGWRIGFAVGNAEILAGLGRVKQNVDSGVFQAVQYAGIAALTGSQACVADNCRIWQERRDVLIGGLRELGFAVAAPKATFYAWVPVPRGFTSSSFTAEILLKTGVVVTPGNGFGAAGEGFVRAAFTVKVERIREALDRIRTLGVRG